jgi:hypothetical protein
MEDLLNASEVKIHIETCSLIQNNSGDTATKRHKAEGLPEAEHLANQISKKYGKSWKKAECCMRFA